ncbi:MAG: lipoyl synthase [Gemmatales bacterium]|nr:lipoyl synthase [Gemmatales bacterium]MDW7993569.1 lipoyl synthase [Gemmatales bacterium]
MQPLPLLQAEAESQDESRGLSRDAGPGHSWPRPTQPSDRGRRLPKWLKKPLPRGNEGFYTHRLLRALRLETVCENSRCPNLPECYSRRTATFMILGNICTRPCGFCAVARGRPLPVEADEPARLAEAVRRLGLRHVVITSVTRDDLPDGGAEHFYRCILAVRQATQATVEVLTPDFLGNWRAVERVVEAAPDVYNHNVETVPRLYRRVRGRADYQRSLQLLAYVKARAPQIVTKSGLMLGLGETREELLEVLADLRQHGCDCLTLGQYLAPSDHHLPVVRYVPPEEFAELGDIAKRMGFVHVASGPFVRSSYHAEEMVPGRHAP